MLKFYPLTSFESTSFIFKKASYAKYLQPTHFKNSASANYVSIESFRVKVLLLKSSKSHTSWDNLTPRLSDGNFTATKFENVINVE